MRNIDQVIIHCADTRPLWWQGKTTSQKVEEVRRWHVQDNGWSDVGYHYLIDRDGTIAEGRPIHRVGAHTRGHNKGSIGIMLFGGHNSSADDDFHDNFTKAQEASLRKLIDELKRVYPITLINGHNEYANKACPGFSVQKWLERVPVIPQVSLPRHAGHSTAPRDNVDQTQTAWLAKIQKWIGGLGITGVGALAAFRDLDPNVQLALIGFSGLVFGIGITVVSSLIRRERQKHFLAGVR